jgi:HK97 family phage prohead protease
MSREANERLKEILGDVNLDLDPTEEVVVDVAELARHRAETPPAEVERKEALTTEATAAPTGEFSAVVSDFEVDRQGERFTYEGLRPAVEKIRSDGKAVPILYGHSHGDVSAVVGLVPSDGWELTDRELIAHGSLDTSDPVAMKLHRLIRQGALQWSISFRPGPSRREGKTRVISAQEIVELSVVPVPANSRTRTLSIKSDPADLTEEEIRQWAEAAGVLQPTKPMSSAALEVERQRILRDFGLDEESQRENAELRKQADYVTVEVALGEDVDAEDRRQKEARELRREADELKLQVAAGDFSLTLGKSAADVGPHARERLRSLIRFYMRQAHPWASCVRDNTRRFGLEGAKKVCAVLKDLGEGTTRWRKAASDPIDTHVDRLLAAVNYDADALIAMFEELRAANGDTPRDHSKAASEARKTRDLMIQVLTGDLE